MICIIDDQNRESEKRRLDEAFKLRHRVLVDAAGWEALRKADGLEIDQFDGPGSVHFLHYEGGRVTGYQRLLPTTAPYLLSEVYPELCEAPIPHDPAIWEWTRIVVDPDRRGRTTVGPTALRLVWSMLDWCQAKGVHRLLLETYPARLLNLAQMHLRIFPLGSVRSIGGRDTLALAVEFDETTSLRLQYLLGAYDQQAA